MATNDELEKMIEQLCTQLNSLQDGFEKYQKLLAQEVETKQLKASESAQIAARDIGSEIAMIEQRLNTHDSTLNTHDGRLNAHDSTLNTHDGRLNAHDSTLNTYDGRLNAHDSTLNTHDGRLNTFAQSISIPGDIQFGATLRTHGRMHIDGGELLYLLNKAGVIVGKDWGGTGDLVVQGNLIVGGSITYAGDIRDSNTPPAPPPYHPNRPARREEL